MRRPWTVGLVRAAALLCAVVLALASDTAAAQTARCAPLPRSTSTAHTAATSRPALARWLPTLLLQLQWSSPAAITARDHRGLSGQLRDRRQSPWRVDWLLQLRWSSDALQPGSWAARPAASAALIGADPALELWQTSDPTSLEDCAQLRRLEEVMLPGLRQEAP